MHEAIIRRAGPADATVLADLGARTFTETFGHLYPPEDLAAFLEESNSPEAAAAVLADPDEAVWLALADRAAIGYAHAGPSRLPSPLAEDCAELKRLYLLKGWQSGGLGRRLMDVALAWLEQRPEEAICIGVWSENQGAQRFYARYGFAKVGEYLFPVGASRDLEYILRRPTHA